MLLAGVLGQFMPIFDRWRRFRIRHEKYLAQERDAETAWIGRKIVSSSQRVLLVLPVLLLIAFLVPFTITTPGFSSSEKIGLAVSLALHLMGLYNMTLPQRDIISQVIGLLVMDHGLYLAVVKIVEVPVPAAFFVISLYFYTAITMFILVILLPELRRQTGSIERAIIAENVAFEGCVAQEETMSDELVLVLIALDLFLPLSVVAIGILGRYSSRAFGIATHAR